MKNIFKLFSLIATLAQLNSCGVIIPNDFIVSGSNEVRQYSNTNPIFYPLVQRFEIEGKKLLNDQNFLVGDIPINFGNTGSPDYKGVCVTYSDGSREILIEKNWWGTAKPLHKESLIYHELGHCRLIREHDNLFFTVGQNTIKASMMNQFIVNPTNFALYKKDYLSELFTMNKINLKTTLGI